MFNLSPGTGQVFVQFKCLIYFANEIIVDEFRAVHLLQHFMTMPDRNVEFFSKLMHAEIIGYHDSRSNLTKGEVVTVGGRWRGATFRYIGGSIFQNMCT